MRLPHAAERGATAHGSLPHSAGARTLPGVEGAEPLVSLRVIHGVCWLTDLKAVGQPRGTPAKNVPPGIARNKLDQAVAGKLPGLYVASLTGDEGDGQPFMSLCDGRAPCRAARIRPYPYPSETGVRRSCAILWPVQYPKCFEKAPKWPRSPVRGSLPCSQPARYSAQSSMSRRRRSNRSVRMYAASTLF